MKKNISFLLALFILFPIIAVSQTDAPTDPENENYDDFFVTEYGDGNLSARVALKIRNDGVVVGRKIVESSTNQSFDRQTLRAIAEAAPFSPFPEEIKSESLVFELTISSTKVEQQRQAVKP